MRLQQRPLISLPRRIAQACEREAHRAFPLETGGVLMGKSTSALHLIHEMIGPGPGAKHTSCTFLPDAEWQWREIARLFNATQGSTTYIGDWHTHPNARRASLSDLDLSAMIEVLTDPKSRTSRMLVIILYGGRKAWKWAAWSAIHDAGAKGSKKMIVEPAKLSLVD